MIIKRQENAPHVPTWHDKCKANAVPLIFSTYSPSPLVNLLSFMGLNPRLNRGSEMQIEEVHVAMALVLLKQHGPSLCDADKQLLVDVVAAYTHNDDVPEYTLKPWEDRTDTLASVFFEQPSTEEDIDDVDHSG